MYTNLTFRLLCLLFFANVFRFGYWNGISILCEDVDVDVDVNEDEDEDIVRSFFNQF